VEVETRSLDQNQHRTHHQDHKRPYQTEPKSHEIYSQDKNPTAPKYIDEFLKNSVSL